MRSSISLNYLYFLIFFILKKIKNIIFYTFSNHSHTLYLFISLNHKKKKIIKKKKKKSPYPIPSTLISLFLFPFIFFYFASSYYHPFSINLSFTLPFYAQFSFTKKKERKLFLSQFFGGFFNFSCIFVLG